MNKDEVCEWVKANITRSEDEVLAMVSRLAKETTTKNAVRDVRIVIDYLNNKGSDSIAAEHGIIGERVRQIVRQALRYIIYYTVRFEYAGDDEPFYRDFSLVPSAARLPWACKESKKVLARLKYIAFKHVSDG